MRIALCALLALPLLASCAEEEPAATGSDETVCRTEERQDQAEQKTGEQSLAEELNPGYQLVYATMSQFAGMSKLTLVKEESEEFEELLEDVSDYAGDLAERLEDLAEEHELIDLEGQPMPKVIGQARKQIGEDFKEQVKPFGGKDGPAMERLLLLALQRALMETRYVVLELAKMETSDERHAVLEDAQLRLGKLLRRVDRMMERKYFCK